MVLSNKIKKKQKTKNLILFYVKWFYLFYEGKEYV